MSTSAEDAAASAPIAAAWFDGRSAAPRAAEIRLRPDGLEVRPEAAAGALWPAADLERLEGPAEAGLRLACHARPGERLTVRDPAAAGRLLEALPALRRAGSRRERRRTLKWVAGALAGLALLGLAAVEGLPRAATWLPMRWVAPIGDNVRAQILEFFGDGVCRAPEASAALDRLSARLLADVEPTLAFDPGAVDILLVDSSVPNALAAPGGRLMVFDGLIRLTDADAAAGGDALAGVIAHEIAHARLRHPTRALGRTLGLDLLARIAGGGMGADAGMILTRLAYGREAEREADALAREMLTAAGIGDAGLSAFFRRIDAEYGGEGGFLATHPATAERAAAGPGVRGPRRAFTEAEWAALRSACD